jgi:S-methylmethionine-dependent homocysteine/selenocysteine methylase
VFAGVNCSSFNDFRKVLDEIHQKGFQISKLGQFKSSSFMELDYRVILGNTGSVIQMSENNL